MLIFSREEIVACLAACYLFTLQEDFHQWERLV